MLIFFVFTVVASAFAITHGTDGGNHQQVLMTLRQLHAQQAALQRDVLQIRSASESYDPLLKSVRALDAGTLRLDHLVQANSVAEQARSVLSWIAAVLCGLVALLVGRLRTRSQALDHQLRFQQAASRAKAELANVGSARLVDNLEAALEAFSDFFQFLDAAFVVEYLGEGGIVARAVNHGIRPRSLRSGRSEHVRERQIDLHSATPLNATLCLVSDRPSFVPAEALDGYLDAAFEILLDATRLHLAQVAKEALEKELEHSRRLEAIGTAAGGVAHEINNCVGAILGYAEMLRQQVRRQPRSARYADEIVEICHRASNMVDQILDFSRKRQDRQLDFDLGAAVDESVTRARAAIGRDARIEFAGTPCPLIIRGHPVEVQQIVINLCRNAAEASPEGGVCTVELGRHVAEKREDLSHGHLEPGTYAKLSVRDTGAGMQRHVYAHLFEPFFTTKTRQGGTGLGLAVVHGSVTAMAGQINVLSSEGRGTRFEVYLRLVSQRPAPMEIFDDGVTGPSGAGISPHRSERA